MRKPGIEVAVPGFLLAATLAAQPLRFDPNLVQVDAIVTGRDGRRVADLKADDFEVLQDGKPQKITQLSYVNGERTIAIVLDDTLLEVEDFLSVRRALTRFIDEGVGAGDRVSLVYTSHGSGALRQFTGDRGLLHRAVEQMYWRPGTGAEPVFPGMAFLREMSQTILELGAFAGRKAVVLVAPGSRAEMGNVQVTADLANRASVTIYSVDGSRAGPQYYSQLALATGGLSLHDPKTTFDQLREAAEDASGYYLIGWNPGADAFRLEPKRSMPYHRVQVRMRDKSLRARTREGFFGRPGTPSPRPAAPPREQMRQALISPFGLGDLEVTLRSGFQRQEAAGSIVDSLMHIAAKGVRFETDSAGCWNARLEVMRTLTPVDPGMPRNERVNEQILDVHECRKAAERVQQEGLVAVVTDRVPTPGAYQVRVAVRNAGVEERARTKTAIGSATQFLVIPDVKRTPLAVAGLTVWGGDAPAAPGGDVTYRPANDGDPAVRRFRTGEEMRYGFHVFGAVEEVRLRVLRDGQEVTGIAGAPETGAIALTGMPPGRYVLGVVASAAGMGKGKPQHSEQWVDFEIR